MFVFEVFGGVGVALMGFEDNGDLRSGLFSVEVEDGEDDVLVSVS